MAPCPSGLCTPHPLDLPLKLAGSLLAVVQSGAPFSTEYVPTIVPSIFDVHRLIFQKKIQKTVFCQKMEFFGARSERRTDIRDALAVFRNCDPSTMDDANSVINFHPSP